MRPGARCRQHFLRKLRKEASRFTDVGDGCPFSGDSPERPTLQILGPAMRCPPMQRAPGAEVLLCSFGARRLLPFFVKALRTARAGREMALKQRRVGDCPSLIRPRGVHLRLLAQQAAQPSLLCGSPARARAHKWAHAHTHTHTRLHERTDMYTYTRPYTHAKSQIIRLHCKPRRGFWARERTKQTPRTRWHIAHANTTSMSTWRKRHNGRCACEQEAHLHVRMPTLKPPSDAPHLTFHPQGHHALEPYSTPPPPVPRTLRARP